MKPAILTPLLGYVSTPEAAVRDTWTEELKSTTFVAALPTPHTLGPLVLRAVFGPTYR